MTEVIKIKKGLDIRIKGKPQKELGTVPIIKNFCIRPSDFHGITPKLLLKEGEQLLAGTPLFYDKDKPEVIFNSPVSGVLKEVVRGEKRKIMEIIIEADGKNNFRNLELPQIKDVTRDELINSMLKNGLWPFIRQRPYSIIADFHKLPKSIHISFFDTSPLAPDISYCIENEGHAFIHGIEVLQNLTDGKINLNLNVPSTPPEFLSEIKDIKINKFTGPHPAGNVGIQIHHLEPINKGDYIWYLQPQDVVIIGRAFLSKKYDTTKTIALTGSEVLAPKYYKLIPGAEILPVIEGNVKEGNNRYISGNVLTGTKIEKNGYLGFYDSQITVIPEGLDSEFLGWMSPGVGKYSFSRTFLSKLFPKKEYQLDTNFHGGERAYVITGEYEKVLPMAILPMQLIKSILVKDIDLMEKLGIYEVSEEDFALCEYICTSKTEIQSIIRDGLDLMIKEMA